MSVRTSGKSQILKYRYVAVTFHSVIFSPLMETAMDLHARFGINFMSLAFNNRIRLKAARSLL